MSANVIVFESSYISQQLHMLNRVEDLLNDASEELKRASEHENWGCPERKRINSDLSELKSRVSRVQGGLADTARVLRDAEKRYVELESRSADNTSSLSTALRKKGYAVTSGRRGEVSSILPVTHIPNVPGVSGSCRLIDTGRNNGSGDADPKLVDAIGRGLVDAGRVVVGTIGSAVGGLMGALGGIASAFIPTGVSSVLSEKSGGGAIKFGNSAIADGSLAVAGVKGFFQGMDGAIDGIENGKRFALDLYEKIFGRSEHAFLNSDHESSRPGLKECWGYVTNGIRKIPVIGSFVLGSK